MRWFRKVDVYFFEQHQYFAPTYSIFNCKSKTPDQGSFVGRWLGGRCIALPHLYCCPRDFCCREEPVLLKENSKPTLILLRKAGSQEVGTWISSLASLETFLASVTFLWGPEGSCIVSVFSAAFQFSARPVQYSLALIYVYSKRMKPQ